MIAVEAFEELLEFNVGVGEQFAELLVIDGVGLGGCFKGSVVLA